MSNTVSFLDIINDNVRFSYDITHYFLNIPFAQCRVMRMWRQDENILKRKKIWSANDDEEKFQVLSFPSISSVSVIRTKLQPPNTAQSHSVISLT